MKAIIEAKLNEVTAKHESAMEKMFAEGITSDQFKKEKEIADIYKDQRMFLAELSGRLEGKLESMELYLPEINKKTRSIVVDFIQQVFA